MLKLLFLDIDGPLSSFDAKGFPLSTGTVVPYGWEKVWADNLKRIINATGSKIVISSDWRNNVTFSEMQEIFVHYGFKKNVLFGYTTNMSTYNGMHLDKGRSDEILAFVHLYRPDKYCAVDDMDLLDYISPEHFVMAWSGINAKQVTELINKLS